MDFQKCIVFILICCLMGLNAIGQTNYYVGKNGSDSNSGAVDQPFLTISKAASVATAGDTVFIHEGTYEEMVTPANSGSAGSPIVFQSFTGEKVVVSAMQALSGS